MRPLHNYCTWQYGVKNRLKMLIYKQYELRFFVGFCLVLPSLVTLCKGLYLYMLIIIFSIFLCLSGAAMADSPAGPDLTDSEKFWLANHSEIILAPAANFYPFEFFDENGTYRGVAADYVALLEKRLGIKFQVVRIEEKRLRMNAIKSAGVDVIAAVTKAPGITESMLLTRPHIILPGVIVARDEYKDIKALSGKKVAAVSGEQWEKLITKKYPDINLVRVPDTATGLELVSLGAVKGLVSDIATASYYIHREGLTDIQISGNIGRNFELAIATRKDWPQLQSILEKTLASITYDEREKISRQWIHLKQPSLLQRPVYRNVIVVIVLTILLGMVSIIVWNRTLKGRVLQRTQALNAELQRRHDAESDLQAAHNDLIHSHQELKITQLKLIHAAKMESIGLLAAGIAHEVKNPLAVIRLGLDYVGSEVGSDVGSELKNESTINDVLKDMGDAISRADTVINRLLDFSREDKLERGPADINIIIENALHLVQHELNQSNIKLVKELAPRLPLTELDASKMQQVFVNLFMNAIQAMRKDGILTVATYQTVIGENGQLGQIEKHEMENGTAVLVAEVKDTGPGVAGEVMGKIFDPFYTTKPAGEGTGLGLSVIRNIVDLHQGAIDIRNRDSGGLAVRIIFRKTETEGNQNE